MNNFDKKIFFEKNVKKMLTIHLVSVILDGHSTRCNK